MAERDRPEDRFEVERAFERYSGRLAATDQRLEQLEKVLTFVASGAPRVNPPTNGGNGHTNGNGNGGQTWLTPSVVIGAFGTILLLIISYMGNTALTKIDFLNSENQIGRERDARGDAERGQMKVRMDVMQTEIVTLEKEVRDIREKRIAEEARKGK